MFLKFGSRPHPMVSRAMWTLVALAVPVTIIAVLWFGLPGSSSGAPTATALTNGGQPVTPTSATSEQSTPSSDDVCGRGTSTSWPIALLPHSDECFRQKYGYTSGGRNPIYESLAGMPADLRAHFIAEILATAEKMAVDPVTLAAINFSEDMHCIKLDSNSNPDAACWNFQPGDWRGGFAPESALKSPAGAVGPFQYSPGAWNGTNYGAQQSTFLTDPSANAAKPILGDGMDGDGDGVADPYNLADSAAAASKFLARVCLTAETKATASKLAECQASLRTTLQGTFQTPDYIGMLKDGLALYNNNTLFTSSPAATRLYAELGANYVQPYLNGDIDLWLKSANCTREGASVTCS